MAENYLEKRREPRESARGTLKLVWDGGPSSGVEGELVDLSLHGFRASHQHAGLVTGQIVDFESSGTWGRARVMWTRILGANVESGFLVLKVPDSGE